MRSIQLAFAAIGCLTVSSALGGPLRYAEDRAPGIVNPLFATSMAEARVNELLFEGLFVDNQELRSVPRLVKTYSVSEDRMEMSIELRPDVRWHDGEPLKPADVVFTIAAMKDRTTASSEAARVAWIASASETQDGKVQLRFVDPEFAPQDKLHFKILPSHVFTSPSVKRSHHFRTRPIGTGPWVLTSFNDDNSISLEQNSMYHSKSDLEGVSMREVSDKNYQSKLLVYESLDALVWVLPRDLAALQNDRKVELHPYQTNSWWYVGFNLRESRFKDPLIREAISLMVDIPSLLAPVGTGETLTGPYVRSSPYYNHDTPNYTHDPDRAATLLAQAGYTFNGRHWLGSDGKALSLRLATQSNLETAQDVMINLQSQLQNRGIQVEPEFLGVAEWKNRVWSQHDFDVLLSQWTFDRNEDIYDQFHSTGARNFVAYANPAVDKLLDEARLAGDPQQKKAILRKVHQTIRDDNPMIFLWTLDNYSAMSVKVKNVVVHPFYFFTWATDWSLN